MSHRKIIHIDMDCFFAACEMRENPALRGLPLAVGSDGPRGVVSTANYAARRFGVHSAMPMATARRLCQQLVIVSPHFELYKSVSAQIHAVFHEYTDMVEPISLDEAFLDVTQNKPGIELAQDIALQIKEKILRTTSLTASAGVSYNKLLAKIASDWQKPDGMTVIHPLRAEDFVSRLPVEKFWGVGQKTAEKMHSLGIFTGQQLRDTPLATLVSHFGKAGRMFHDFARGIDHRPVVTERIRKSVGCEETFLTDLYRADDIERELDKLLADLATRIKRSGFEGRTLVLKVKYFDFVQITRSATVDKPLTTSESISPVLRGLLSQVSITSQKPVRLLGLTVTGTPAPPIRPGRICLPDFFDEEFDEWY